MELHICDSFSTDVRDFKQQHQNKMQNTSKALSCFKRKRVNVITNIIKKNMISMKNAETGHQNIPVKKLIQTRHNESNVMSNKYNRKLLYTI